MIKLVQMFSTKQYIANAVAEQITVTFASQDIENISTEDQMIFFP